MPVLLESPETLTSLRKDIFNHAENALHGKKVQFLYKGTIFRIVPETVQRMKIERLVGEPTVAPGIDLELAGTELSAEIAAAWDKKWDDL